MYPSYDTPKGPLRIRLQALVPVFKKWHRPAPMVMHRLQGVSIKWLTRRPGPPKKKESIFEHTV